MIFGIIIAVIIILIETFVICNLKSSKKEDKQPKIKISKEEKEKQKEIQKAFNNLMNYDYDAAMRGE